MVSPSILGQTSSGRCKEMVLFSGCDREYFLNDDIIIRTRLDASDECKPLKIVKSMWRVYFGSKFLFSYANRLNALEIPRFRLREFGNYAVHFDFSGEVLDALGNFKLDLSRKCHLTMSPADIEISIPEGTRQIARCPVDEQLKIEIRIMDPNAKLRARTSSIVASAHLEGEKISDGIFDVIVNTLATVLIILYGLQYGRNRSIIWLKTLAMSLIEDATVIVPLKIFATS
ncbi:unnamed protein product, partial [Nesidiocoris tenuis]